MSGYHDARAVTNSPLSHPRYDDGSYVRTNRSVLSVIEIVDTGLVWRNPKPYLRAAHTWHPCVNHLGDGRLVATFDIGQAVESLDYRTSFAHSDDEGRTWSDPQRMLAEPVCERATSHSVRVGLMDNGELFGMGGLMYRDDPEAGIINHESLGMGEMDVIRTRSADGGRTWGVAQIVKMPLVGPAFEVCHAPMALRDGRWLWPAATWRDWNGDAAGGMRAIAVVSEDQGATWGDHLEVMDDYANGVFHWEQSMIELADGRLLAICWRYHEPSGRSVPNHFAISADGRTFDEPRACGFNGETAKLTRLNDGRILCLYRHAERSGLWANVSEIDGDDWINQDEAPVWQGATSAMRGVDTGGDELSALKFGFPSSTLLSNGEVFAVFWCTEDCVNNIRWVRLRTT